MEYRFSAWVESSHPEFNEAGLLQGIGNFAKRHPWLSYGLTQGAVGAATAGDIAEPLMHGGHGHEHEPAAAHAPLIPGKNMGLPKPEAPMHHEEEPDQSTHWAHGFVEEHRKKFEELWGKIAGWAEKKAAEGMQTMQTFGTWLIGVKQAIMRFIQSKGASALHIFHTPQVGEELSPEIKEILMDTGLLPVRRERQLGTTALARSRQTYPHRFPIETGRQMQASRPIIGHSAPRRPGLRGHMGEL
jgi:hypothetical protein